MSDIRRKISGSVFIKSLIRDKWGAVREVTRKPMAKKATAKKATAAYTVICQQRRHLRRMPS